MHYLRFDGLGSVASKMLSNGCIISCVSMLSLIETTKVAQDNESFSAKPKEDGGNLPQSANASAAGDLSCLANTTEGRRVAIGDGGIPAQGFYPDH